ncbi:YibE/F family protein [Nonomuraea sp. 3-1Str]|uniref:YibE/F family protein n=1 Tax=Nonomuraea sp. 3-1Str TaxID=2929801 RepID=UPI00285D29F5|nr:YibE/F family protein [Nonomuraea sp. 3-1Str]MDR8413305.1 YibE/F family protein [Nonomuraea sp. 3-1Str]
MGAGHGHGHHHGGSVPASRRAVVATLAVLVPLAVATLVMLVWLWPSGRSAEPAGAGFDQLGGTVTAVLPGKCAQVPEGAAPPDPATCGHATVRVDEGPDLGREVKLALPTGPGTQPFAAGDDVVLIRVSGGEEPEDEPGYQLSDHDRTDALWLSAVAFALAVIAFGRWRGVTALVGLAITFVLLLAFVIPGILEGEPPMLVAIVGAAAIMLTVLFLTHGFTLTTSMAVLGTLASLTVTGLLAYGAIGFARLTGVTDDSSFMLGLSTRIDTQGLLLASVIIGALGVLDDVTVTQAVTVTELAAANPSYGWRRLYRAGSRVGRAHIASVINTIILAYAGASLPLLLLFSVGAQPLGEVLGTPVIAQEIIRSVVGTLGLISAVPITTALSALVASRRGAFPGETAQPTALLPSTPSLRRARS